MSSKPQLSLVSSSPPLEGPSMTTEDIQALLKEHGIKPLEPDYWQPGQPVLFVFDDDFHVGDFTKLLRRRKPNVARLDNPANWRQGMITSCGQVDYYAVDPNTRTTLLVKQSDHTKEPRNFAAAKKHLFLSCDSLFPKSPPPRT